MPPRRKPRSEQSSRRRRGAAPEEGPIQAQRLIEQAFDADDPRRQVALARQALALSPDCPDAYRILAACAATAQEALPLLESAVESAARVIGEDGFREMGGHFWGFVETRPYMQARLELTECLWELGRVDEAIGHYRAMLELNPGDNQGVRYRLLSALLETDRLDELESLLRSYPDDDTAEWYYTRALLAFKRQGDSEAARESLREARRMNEHVPALLTGAERLPLELPELISLGHESEAISFVAEHLRFWRGTPGAIPWLRTTLKVSRPAGRREARRVSWKRAAPMLRQLPQAEETDWELELLRLPAAPSSGVQRWAFVVVDADTAEPLLLETWDERPRDSELWRHLLEVMRNPRPTEPQRPRAVRLTRKTWLKTWGPKLEQIGVRCELADELPQIAVVEESFEAAFQRAAGGHREAELPADDSDLEQLPQAVGEVWRAAVRKVSAWIQVGDEMRRPTVRLVVDTTNDAVLATGVVENDPPADWLWEAIRLAATRPAMGEPRRPGVVELSPEAPLEAFRPRLESIGVRCVVSEDTRLVDELVDGLTEHLAGPRRIKALVRIPGITPAQLGGFYAAAADFYRAAPWRRIPGDTVIQVASDAFSSPWYAVVMGQQGMELGLALYEDLALLRKILTGRLSEEENARLTSALSVTFGEVFDIAPEDGDAISEHGWPVAAEEAYPIVLRVNPGLALRSPLAWEMDLLEACLRAVPDWIRKGQPDTSTRTVTTATREFSLRLSRLD